MCVCMGTRQSSSQPVVPWCSMLDHDGDDGTDGDDKGILFFNNSSCSSSKR